MVILKHMLTESVSLTKQKGQLLALDGNTLYFTYRQGSGAKTITAYGKVDLSVSRTRFERVEDGEVPKQVMKRVFDVDERQVTFGAWLMNYSGLSVGDHGWLPIFSPSGERSSKRFEDVSLRDFKQALLVLAHQPEGHPDAELWGITQELIDAAQQWTSNRKLQLEKEANSEYHSVRELNEVDTAVVASIFDFNGDAKSLVTALKSSWGVELKDSEVKVDKLGFSKTIKLPSTVEELIP